MNISVYLVCRTYTHYLFACEDYLDLAAQTHIEYILIDTFFTRVRANLYEWVKERDNAKRTDRMTE